MLWYLRVSHVTDLSCKMSSQDILVQLAEMKIQRQALIAQREIDAQMKQAKAEKLSCQKHAFFFWVLRVDVQRICNKIKVSRQDDAFQSWRLNIIAQKKAAEEELAKAEELKSKHEAIQAAEKLQKQQPVTRLLLFPVHCILWLIITFVRVLANIMSLFVVLTKACFFPLFANLLMFALAYLFVNVGAMGALWLGYLNIFESCVSLEIDMRSLANGLISATQHAVEASEIYQGDYKWYQAVFNEAIGMWNYVVPWFRFDLFPMFVAAAAPRAAQVAYTWTTIGLGVAGVSFACISGALVMVPGLATYVYVNIPPEHLAWFATYVFDFTKYTVSYT